MTEGELINAGWADFAGGTPAITASTPLTPSSGVSAPAQWFLDALGGAATTGGVRVNSWTALQSTPLAAAIRCLSQDIAKLPIRLYKVSDDGREELRTHPVLNVLARKPNRWMTCYDFKAYMVSQYALNGNAIAVISRGGDGRPFELIPVDPARVALWQSDKELWYYVSFTNELNRLQFGVAGALFPAADILHIKWELNWQGLWGYSPIQLARETIANGIVLDRYAGALYANYADVGGILIHPNRIGEAALENLRRQWETRYTGENNKGRTAVLEEGMTFEKLSMTAQDAEFILNRKFSVEEICRLYRIPPYKMMDLTRTIQSNIEEQSQGYFDDTLNPIIQNFEEAYTDKLLVAREPWYLDIEHDISEFIRGRETERMQVHIQAVQNGILCPDEARLKEGLNAAPDGLGGKFYRSNNMVPRDLEPADLLPQPDPVQQQAEADAARVLSYYARRKVEGIKANGHDHA